MVQDLIARADYIQMWDARFSRWWRFRLRSDHHILRGLIVWNPFPVVTYTVSRIFVQFRNSCLIGFTAHCICRLHIFVTFTHSTLLNTSPLLLRPSSSLSFSRSSNGVSVSVWEIQTTLHPSGSPVQSRAAAVALLHTNFTWLRIAILFDVFYSVSSGVLDCDAV
jgi:hypothetical protein